MAGAEEQTPRPTLQKPSKQYVQNYIQARNSQQKFPTPTTNIRARNNLITNKIFNPLDEQCPEQYFPKLREVSPLKLNRIRSILCALCLAQAALSYYVHDSATLHDSAYQQFGELATILVAVAAACGILGAVFRSRALLLFSYVSQIWSLSNICTFFIMHIADHEQELSACRLLQLGDLPAEEASAEIKCGDVDEKHRLILQSMSSMLLLLWAGSYFGRTLSELFQDERNDADDRALVNFVWQRRRETQTQLRQFEGQVLRQFEELREGLMSHQ